MTFRRLAIPTVLCLAALASATDARAGDPGIGEMRARQWCADCHLVAPGQDGPVPDVPPTFMEMARDPRGPDYIATFLKAPHFETMKGLQISTYDIADLVAYIESLRQE